MTVSQPPAQSQTGFSEVYVLGHRPRLSGLVDHQSSASRRGESAVATTTSLLDATQTRAGSSGLSPPWSEQPSSWFRHRRHMPRRSRSPSGACPGRHSQPMAATRPIPLRRCRGLVTATPTSRTRSPAGSASTDARNASAPSTFRRCASIRLRCSAETVANLAYKGSSVTCAGALEGTFRTYARGYAWPNGVQTTRATLPG
jgi:hypothetical protein